MDYTTYTNTMAVMAAQNNVTDVNWVTILPRMIEYAEQRIYRELDILESVDTDTSVVLTTGLRSFTIPNTFIVVNGINVISPAGTTNPELGTRNPLTVYTRDYLDATWPGGTTGLPTDAAPLTQWGWLLGPAPDGAYTLEVIGTTRPAPLSVANPTTYLSTYLPDLFLAASMIFLLGYQKNFGAQASDPASAMSWETQYGKLLASADLEQERLRFRSTSWASQSPAPAATPPRA